MRSTYQTKPSSFYPLLYRNLNTLRDIYRLITTARQTRQKNIRFKDEQGMVWELRQLGSSSKFQSTQFTPHQIRSF